jgi:hypothetical protein
MPRSSAYLSVLARRSRRRPHARLGFEQKLGAAAAFAGIQLVTEHAGSFVPRASIGGLASCSDVVRPGSRCTIRTS